MADITLEKPKAGEHITVPAHAGARFVIKFDTSEATPKKDGANFIFIFEDDSSITITNFYGQPQSILPELYWQEELMSAEDFFARLETESHEEPARGSIATARNADVSEEPSFDMFLNTLSSDFLTEHTYIDKLLHHDELFLSFTEVSKTKAESFSEKDFLFPMSFSFDDGLYGDSYELGAHQEVFLQSTYTSNDSTAPLPALEDVLSHGTEIPEHLLAFQDAVQEQKNSSFLHEIMPNEDTDKETHLEQSGQSISNSYDSRFMEYSNEETETTILVQQILIVIT